VLVSGDLFKDFDQSFPTLLSCIPFSGSLSVRLTIEAFNVSVKLIQDPVQAFRGMVSVDQMRDQYEISTRTLRYYVDGCVAPSYCFQRIHTLFPSFYFLRQSTAPC
jgi:hypothetical protein